MGLFGKKANPGKYLDMALRTIQGVGTPDVAKMWADPAMARSVLQGRSAMGGIKRNPVYNQAALKALTGLQQVASEGGLTAIDRARLADVQDTQRAENRGAQEAIMANAAERGVSGSGLEMANRLIAQQSSAGRANRAGLDVAAQAQERALRALEQSGEIGERMGAREFDEQAQVAQAQDAIDRFNTANRQNTEMTNVGTRNDFQLRNKDLYQRDFENRMRKAEGAAGIYGKYADAEEEKRRRRYGVLKDVASAAAGAGALMEK